MARQVIAVDIDDVLAATAAEWVDYSNRQWGTTLSVEDYHEDWSVMWQVDRLEESRRANQLYEERFFSTYGPDASAEAVLKRLNRRYDLVIATSRVYKVHTETVEWLDKHFGGIFKDIHHSGIYDPVVEGPLPERGRHHLTKGQLMAQIGADYLIDDQPKHCLAAASAGIEAILFGDYGWNRRPRRLPPRVTRCHDWAAVEAYFAAR